jgi:hypothetical protein
LTTSISKCSTKITMTTMKKSSTLHHESFLTLDTRNFCPVNSHHDICYVHTYFGVNFSISLLDNFLYIKIFRTRPETNKKLPVEIQHKTMRRDKKILLLKKEISFWIWSWLEKSLGNVLFGENWEDFLLQYMWMGREWKNIEDLPLLRYLIRRSW